MIVLKEISLSFADKVIFDKISCRFTSGSVTGIVGENGTGKTTMLRSILKSEVLDSGFIETNPKFKINLLEQESTELPKQNLLDFIMEKTGIFELEEKLEFLEIQMGIVDPESREYNRVMNSYQDTVHMYEHKGGYSFKSEALRILKGLGFKPNDENRLCSDFSGGWRIRISLALLLLSKPDIMLLDEPTNHLDTESIEWLESYLKKYHGTIVTISHDRRFLNKLANQIIELHQGGLTIYKGNFDYYEREKVLRIERLKKEYESQKSEIKKIQDFIDRFRSKASKAKQVQSRIKMLEKFKEIKLYEESKRVNIKFPEATHSGIDVVKIENLTKSYGDNLVLSNIDLTIERGLKLALVGVNGAGKSTLSRMISNEEDPTSGSITYGHNVRQAYFSQISSENLDNTLTIWEEVSLVSTKLNEIEKRNLLGAFLFSGEDIHKKICVLSGGEKSRLSLLKILLVESNLLILDEPTNHLDEKTKNVFQQALKNYLGTVLIVSHDRYFLDGLISRIYEVKDSKIKEYLGNYSYFIEKRDSDKQKSEISIAEKNDKIATTSKPKEYKSKEQKKQNAQKRNLITKNRKKIDKEIESLENKLSDLEVRKKELMIAMGNSENHNNTKLIVSLNKEFSEIETSITKTYELWENKSLELEKILKDL